MNKQSKILSILILLLVLLIVAVPGEAAPAQQTNLLQNPGFEFPYNGDGAASKWVRWDQVSSADQFGDCTNGYMKSPSWSAETNSALVQSGSVSQHVGNQWDTWHAGVWQNVSVNPGSTYRFTFWARGRGSNDQYPKPSEGGLNMNVQAGIDPSGNGGIWYDSDIVWSGSANPHDNWQQVSVEATAVNSTITVYTSANWAVKGVNQCRAHLDVWFDTAELIEVGPPPTNTPPPQPTSPPAPLVTNTPVPPAATATPAETATFTPIPTDTPVPTPEGSAICVNAFNDENGNGTQDANEGYMAGVTFTVASPSEMLGQGIATGSANPVCFQGLANNTYQVRQILPARLEPTTVDFAEIVVVEPGQTYGVLFGSRIRVETETPESTATPVVTPTVEGGGNGSEGTSPNTLVMFGIVLLVVAVVILGGVLFMLLRRPSE
ncbi:MAG: hypothetical protein IAF02_20490 [Anaerolineae bacterium]|nr:hypothetical protein [Anaerolineae bacterium]